MNYNKIDDDFIENNNTLILSQYKIQLRYKPDIQPDAKFHENPSVNKNTINESKKHVTDTIKTVLWEIYKCQYKKALTEIQKLSGLSAGTFSRSVQKCVRKKLIEINQISFGKGRRKYSVLLPEGYAILNIQEKTFNGRGAGNKHTLYQHLLYEHFKDLKPVIELNRNGKFIDVAIETSEYLICIEVAMTAVHEKENIEKDLSLAKAHTVIVACATEKVKIDVQNILHSIEESMLPRVDVIYIAELLKIKPDEFIMKYHSKLLL